MNKGGFCLACKKPFDDVHPLDWLNDELNCRKMHERIRPLLDGLHVPIYVDRKLCRVNHTWREHVDASWNGTWMNPHIRVETLPSESS